MAELGSGVKPPQIKEEEHELRIKSEPEEDDQCPTDTVGHCVQTEDDIDKCELQQRLTEEKKEEPDEEKYEEQSDSSDTDCSEDWLPQQTKAQSTQCSNSKDCTDNSSDSEALSGKKSNTFICPEQKRHMSVHIRRRPHKCSLCQNSFKEKTSISKPLIHDHLHCLVCKKQFTKKSELDLHLRNHVKLHHLSVPRHFTGENPHTCSLCDRSWKYKHDLHKHLRKEHGFAFSKDKTALVKTPKTSQRPLSCSDCGKRFKCKSDLQRHLSVHTGEKPFKCSVCEKGFCRKPQLREHQQSIHHICPVCVKHFQDECELNKHLPTHTEESILDQDRLGPWSCTECGREFKFRSDFKRHMTFHTGERPHKCSVCERGFSLSNDLRIHMMSHTGERPFICAVCGKGFTGKNKLTRHQRSIHHVCSVCKAGFMSKIRLEEHQRSHQKTGSNQGQRINLRASSTAARTVAWSSAARLTSTSTRSSTQET